MNRNLLWFVLLSACAATSTADNTLTVRYDPGGWIDARKEEVQRLWDAGTRVKIEGRCYSSCTMYLALRDRVCATPDATLGFHAPNFFGIPAWKAEHDRGVAAMSAYYPPGLREWYRRRFRNPTLGGALGVVEFSGQKLIDLGYVRQCYER